jgi:hypothetical protein
MVRREVKAQRELCMARILLRLFLVATKRSLKSGVSNGILLVTLYTDLNAVKSIEPS